MKQERSSPDPIKIKAEDLDEIPEPPTSSLYGLTLDDVADFDLNTVPGPFGRQSKSSHVYVVWKGRVPGLYYNWNDAHDQVNRFSGCSYAKYGNLDEGRIAWFTGRVVGVGVPHPHGTLSQPERASQPPPQSSQRASRLATQPPAGSVPPSPSPLPPPRRRNRASHTTAAQRGASVRATPPRPPAHTPTPPPAHVSDVDMASNSDNEVETATVTSVTTDSDDSSGFASADDDESDALSYLDPAELNPPRSRESTPGPARATPLAAPAINPPLVWVVLRGVRPGVYRRALDAIGALGRTRKGKMVSAADMREGDRHFRRKHMKGKVVTLRK